jgi:hypothetical protein
MVGKSSLGHAIAWALLAAPWAWLICFAVFTASATAVVGHFPSYSNPDPKHVEGLEPLYQLTVVLLLPLLLSPIVLGAYAASLRWRGRAIPWRNAAAYAAGMAIAASVLFGNAFGLGNWLFD